ncbi:MAG: TetR/AcrR family transcriptional regulator, partial [Parvularculaceae bacterium]|nr:TetR/AcrR family transcriptional regulator [Parvularculaceae bacterium]
MARTSDPLLAEKRRRQIIEAALRCFSRKGFHQTSMQEICAEAELSAGALYRYFPSKSELIVAIAEADCMEFRAPLLSESAGRDFFSRLDAAIDVWIERLLSNDRSLVAEVLAEATRDPFLAAKLAQTDAPMRRALADMIREGMARGEIDGALDVDQCVRIVVLALDGVALRLLLLPARENVPLVMKDIHQLFRRYFAPRGVEAAPRRKTRALAETAA